MRSIIGLQQPVSGEIEVLGQPMLDGEPEDLRQIRRRWGVLFQAGALFSTLTVAENVQVPLREYYRLDEALLDDIAAYKISMRSEEHTSALQSLMRISTAVFCLTKITTQHSH